MQISNTNIVTSDAPSPVTPSAASHLSSSPQTTNEVLVRVEGVKKKFCRSLKKSLWYGVKDMATEVMGGKGHHDQLREGEFWAVNDISFELRRGECLGLIGRNGAGKTTLLKLLNGLIKPDHGKIQMHGRIGALIALGAGFNPILTGRENIYINGSVLGLSKREIDEKIDDIIDFADIRDFIDAPVQSYSSGMQVRLGFAVATALEPDVLILDEVLAVGDVNFRTKCFVRISSLLSRAAVIFVSHSEEQLSRICTSGVLLDHGRAVYQGQLRNCLEKYRNLLPIKYSSDLNYQDNIISEMDIFFYDSRHNSGEDLCFEIHYSSKEFVELSLYAIQWVDDSEVVVAVCNLLPNYSAIEAGKNIQKLKIKSLCLRPGNYIPIIEALSTKHGTIIARKKFKSGIRVAGSISYWASYTPKAERI